MKQDCKNRAQIQKLTDENYLGSSDNFNLRKKSKAVCPLSLFLEFIKFPYNCPCFSLFTGK